MTRKWYVGDRYDNWSSHNSYEDAAKVASILQSTELEGNNENFVYMMCLTAKQFDAMCKSGLSALA